MREGACIGGATMLQPWTLRLTRNAAALAAKVGINDEKRNYYIRDCRESNPGRVCSIRLMSGREDEVY